VLSAAGTFSCAEPVIRINHLFEPIKERLAPRRGARCRIGCVRPRSMDGGLGLKASDRAVHFRIRLQARSTSTIGVARETRAANLDYFSAYGSGRPG